MLTAHELILIARFRSLKGKARKLAEHLQDNAQEALLISILRGDTNQLPVIPSPVGHEKPPLTR